MKELAWDIETVRNERAKEYYLQKNYTAPSNYKDEAKIDAYIQAARQKDIDKAALFWWTGQIVCISTYDLDTDHVQTFVGDNEKELLTKFFTHLQSFDYTDPNGQLWEGTDSVTLIGKSSEMFDRPYVIGRALYQNIGLPKCLQQKRPVWDINHIFSRSSACQQVSKLSDYAWGLNIDGKIAHGSEVQAMYDEGKFDDIAKYCAQDTAIVAEMRKRYKKEFKA